jgi:hypothetical protein
MTSEVLLVGLHRPGSRSEACRAKKRVIQKKRLFIIGNGMRKVNAGKRIVPINFLNRLWLWAADGRVPMPPRHRQLRQPAD